MRLWTIEPPNYDGDLPPLFIDAGANIGACSCFMAYHGIDTISFEPNPLNFQILRKSVLFNKDKFANFIKIFRVGLGDKEYLQDIYYDETNFGNSVAGVAVGDFNSSVMVKLNDQIKIMKLDDMVWTNRKNGSPAPNVHLMKIDVQGYESLLLEGAKDLIASRAIKMIKLEVGPQWLFAHNSSAHQLCSFLVARGYYLYSEELIPIGAEVCHELDERQRRISGSYPLMKEIIAVLH